MFVSLRFLSHNENMARARIERVLQFYFVLFLLLNCVIWGVSIRYTFMLHVVFIFTLFDLIMLLISVE